MSDYGVNDVIVIVGDAVGCMVIYDYYEGLRVNGKLPRAAAELGIVRFGRQTIVLNIVKVSASDMIVLYVSKYTINPACMVTWALYGDS